MRKDPNMMVFKTPVGWAGVAVSGHGVCSIVLPKKDKRAVERVLSSSESGVLSSERNTSGSAAVLGKAVRLIQKYFSGERVSFDLPLDMRYHTAFQQAVWKMAAKIPFGETRSYGWIAKMIEAHGRTDGTLTSGMTLHEEADCSLVSVYGEIDLPGIQHRPGFVQVV